MRLTILVLIVLASGCKTGRYHAIAVPTPQKVITGSGFYSSCVSCRWRERDSLAVLAITGGNLPGFLRRFVPVTTSLQDSNRVITATYYVSPDYVAIGTDEDWARIPLTPMAAQKIADSFNCFLPTRKMVDDIYKSAVIKLAPVPMFAFRDSTVTMWHHHLIIEGQRKGRDGLIAGIKKDVVLSAKVLQDHRPNRVAIYGWHLLDGKPIQPLYTGHVNWYVDYSHGLRLVYRRILVNGKEMDYSEVLKHPVYHKLICDEDRCDMYKYSY